MAYGLSSAKKDGQWLVFDFGGGTFDAALIKVEDGIMQVKDTEGDNYLGGKNLDYAIVDKLIIPFLQENYSIDELLEDEGKKKILRDALKVFAERAKNKLSFNPVCDDVEYIIGTLGEDEEGEELDLTELVITQEELKDVLSPIFQKAIDIVKDLLKRNNLKGSNLDSLILVGGPTYSPILRDMLKEQVTSKVDTSIDPMTAVAKGAALFASGIDSEVKEVIKSGTIALDLTYEANSVEPCEYVTVQLLRNECTGHVPAKLYVEFVRSDKGWSSGKVEINDMGDVIECQLMEGKNNAFSVVAYDDMGNTISCFPNEINIMQGIVVGNAVLPYHIGIEVHDSTLDKDVFIPLKGLEKNQQLPATGVRNALKTQKALRPGIESDRMVIPIYQGEHNAEGTTAIYNDHVFDVVITGDDVPALIPENSDLDITVKVDRSQMLTLEAFFPSIGETIEKTVEIAQRSAMNENELSNLCSRANSKLRALSSQSSISPSEYAEAQNALNDINSRFDGEKTSEDGRMHLLADLRRAFLKMEEVEKNHEWDSLEAEIREEFARLEKANNELGHKYDAQVNALRSQVDNVIRSKDPKIARSVLKDIDSLFFAVTMIYQLMGCIEHYSNNFGRYKWKNSTRARQLLNQGMELLNGNPTEQQLRPIAVEVLNLLDMPESEKLKI